MNTTEDPDVRRRIERLETLIQDLERLPDPGRREQAREMVQTLLDFHGAAVCAAARPRSPRSGEPGRARADRVAGGRRARFEPALALRSSSRSTSKTRVDQALERVRPYLRSHKGDVELVGVIDGVVTLRMQGSCHGCPSSAMTLKLAIEEAIYAAAPDVAAIEVEGVVEPPARRDVSSDRDRWIPGLTTQEPGLAGLE